MRYKKSRWLYYRSSEGKGELLFEEEHKEKQAADYTAESIKDISEKVKNFTGETVFEDVRIYS